MYEYKNKILQTTNANNKCFTVFITANLLNTRIMSSMRYDMTKYIRIDQIVNCEQIK